MPLFTFYNLSEEKQKKIIHISLGEFAGHDYESASVSRIVKQVGVAKGSFYRYFRNKFDLYSFMLNHCLEVQEEESHAGLSPGLNFSEFLIQYCFSRISFAIEFPLHGKFLSGMRFERNGKELGKLLLRHKQGLMKPIIKRIEAYQLSGELREDLDKEWLAFQVIQLPFGIEDYFSFQLDKINKRAKEKMTLADMEEDEVLRVIKGFSSMLVGGILSSTASELIPSSSEGQPKN